MKEKKIYFVIGNHREFVGIKSYFLFIKELFSSYKIIKTKDIQKNSINILVENFKKNEVQQIINNKKKFNSKIIFILTEFVNNKAETYNSFELDKEFYKYIPFNLFNMLNIGLVYIFIYFLIVILFFDLKISNFYILILTLIYAIGPTLYYNFKQYFKKILTKHTKFNLKKYRNFKKIFFGYKKKKKYKGFSIRNTKFYINLVLLRYFKERFIQANKLINHADILLVSHPSIYKTCKKKNNKTYYVFPKIKNFKPNKLKNSSKIFKFSGELTNYRYEFFDKIYENTKKFFKNEKNYFEPYYLFFKNLKKKQSGNFIDIKSTEKYKYSFHPKKRSEWYFSSPIRYIEALKNGEIPIIFDNYKDVISKNLAIKLNENSKSDLLNILKFNSKQLKYIKTGIINYNLFLIKNKSKIFDAVKILEKSIEKKI